MQVDQDGAVTQRNLSAKLTVSHSTSLRIRWFSYANGRPNQLRAV